MFQFLINNQYHAYSSSCELWIANRLATLRARLNPILMNELGILAGVIIEISGKRATMVILIPSFPNDYGNGIIGINGNIRKNSGTKLDDNI